MKDIEYLKNHRDEFENRNICSMCDNGKGGLCCRIAGCSYEPDDFDSLKVEDIGKILDGGRASISASLDIKFVNGSYFYKFLLYLRAREVGKGEIDLFSLSAPCLSLEKDHCYFDITDRPSEGVMLIPSVDGCYPKDLSVFEKEDPWIKYQKVLARVVKRRTGKSVSEVLKEDAENLYYKLAIHDLEGIHEQSIKSFMNQKPIYDLCFAKEKMKGELRAKKANLIRTRTK